jgi:hypothetical protein
MADFVANIAKGRVHQLAKNVKDGTPANSRLIAVVIESSGIEADATLKDYDSLSTLLAGSSNEQTTMGRKTIAAADITITVDDTNDRVDVDMADLVWTGASGNAVGAIILCYDADNTTGTDADLVPLTKHDFIVTPDGSDITAQVNTAGFYRAKEPGA